MNYREEDFVAAVKDATGGKGADVILDMVGGDYVARNYHAAAVEGRIVQIATQRRRGGEHRFRQADGEAADPYRLDAAAPHASSSRARSPPRSKRRSGRCSRRAQVAPVMDMIFPLKEAWRAHERMEEGEHIGKIVLDVG